MNNAEPTAWSAVLLDATTFLIARTPDEIRELVAGIRSRRTRLPAKWAAAAEGLDIESPLVMVRRYNASNPFNAELKPDDPEASQPKRLISLAVVQPDAAQSRYEVQGVSAEPAKDAALLMEMSQSTVKWRTEFLADRFKATLSPRYDEDHVPLYLIIFFGYSFYI